MKGWASALAAAVCHRSIPAATRIESNAAINSARRAPEPLSRPSTSHASPGAGPCRLNTSSMYRPTTSPVGDDLPRRLAPRPSPEFSGEREDARHGVGGSELCLGHSLDQLPQLGAGL